MQVEHAAAAAAVLAREKDFEPRLRGVLEAWLDVAAPNHEFAGQFFKNAADPDSPLSPFSDESAPAREASTELYRRVVEGADLKLAPALRRELPGLLWLLQMGVVLFWVHDRSRPTRPAPAPWSRRAPRSSTGWCGSRGCPSCAASSTTSSGCIGAIRTP